MKFKLTKRRGRYVFTYRRMKLQMCARQLGAMWSLPDPSYLHIATEAEVPAIRDDTCVHVALHRPTPHRAIAILCWPDGLLVILPVSPMLYWAWKMLGRPEWAWFTDGDGRCIPVKALPSIDLGGLSLAIVSQS